MDAQTKVKIIMCVFGAIMILIIGTLAKLISPVATVEVIAFLALAILTNPASFRRYRGRHRSRHGLVTS